MSLSAGARIELQIASLATGGDGVGRFEGRVIFVPRTAPGDRVCAEVIQVRRRYARAQLIDVLASGPSRRHPPCPYFGRCGGCSWLHLDEDAQCRARERILCDALTRVGGVRELPSVAHVRSPVSLGYRSRARVAYGQGRVGQRAARSHDVVDIEHCLVLDHQTQHELDLLRENPPKGQGETNIRGYDKQVEVAGRRLRVGPEDFFQANSPLWESWFASVVASCGTGALAVELFAGVGFYTFGLEERFSQVIAVERGSAARNLSRNTNARVFQANAESWLPLQVGRLTPDLILLNPPRTGCDGRVIDAASALEPARLVYVSCDPMTLARDVSRLGTHFQLRRLLLLDALPQTHHVEAVVVLEHIDICDSTSVTCSSSTGVSSAGK